jgi:hypothetical protein
MHVRDTKVVESARHQSTIEALARETRAEPSHVRQLYDHALSKLEANAKVRDYLSVLAQRSVRTALREARSLARP